MYIGYKQILGECAFLWCLCWLRYLAKIGSHDAREGGFFLLSEDVCGFLIFGEYGRLFHRSPKLLAAIGSLLGSNHLDVVILPLEETEWHFPTAS